MGTGGAGGKPFAGGWGGAYPAGAGGVGEDGGVNAWNMPGAGGGGGGGAYPVVTGGGGDTELTGVPQPPQNLAFGSNSLPHVTQFMEYSFRPPSGGSQPDDSIICLDDSFSIGATRKTAPRVHARRCFIQRPETGDTQSYR